VACAPNKICLLTDIGYDHTEILGEALAEIAAQKAGIIHPGNQVFMHKQTQKIMSPITAAVSKKRAELHFASEKSFPNLPQFQAHNASLALAAVEFALARDDQQTLTKTQIAQALQVAIPARSEEFFYHGKRVVIDGAHNPQKLTAFTQHVIKKYHDQKISLIVAFGSNKNATLNQSLTILRQISPTIILTTFKDTSVETHFRTSINPQIMRQAAHAAGFSQIKIIPDPVAALGEAVNSEANVIIATGSFFLLNHLRPLLVQ
jgi:dihydrofolate synthase/folylpolyglutamate synthase